MINLNLNIKNLKELKAAIVYLREEGLIKTNNVEKRQEPENIPGRSPRATHAEMAIRKKIDRERINSGKCPVNWLNFSERRRVLSESGFDIGKRAVLQDLGFTMKEEGATFDGQVSLDNVP